jgi:hypothetical protein
MRRDLQGVFDFGLLGWQDTTRYDFKSSAHRMIEVDDGITPPRRNTQHSTGKCKSVDFDEACWGSEPIADAAAAPASETDH